ncbi:hypothetical protein ACFL0P_03315 [Candidatus Omnitrophota bacterium]
MKKRFTLCLCILIVHFISFNSVRAQEQTTTLEKEQFKPREIKVDKNYDGVVDKVEVYNEEGIIVRLEVDRTGDGKMNEKVYYKNGDPARAERDIDGDGKTDVFLTYDEEGMILESETDTNGDGKVDEKVFYKNGSPAKAEKDTDGDGEPDTWLTY